MVPELQDTSQDTGWGESDLVKESSKEKKIMSIIFTK